jgi:hypothetical protein
MWRRAWHPHYGAYGGHDSRKPIGRVTLEKVREILQEKFEQDLHGQSTVRLIGLIFGRPALPLFREQLLPNFGYWHHRTSTYTDFFTMGFADSVKSFSDREFVKAVTQVETSTSWRYSGGTDLIVANACFDRKLKTLAFDWTCAIVIPLEEALATGAIRNVTSLFEKTCRQPRWTQVGIPLGAQATNSATNLAGTP